jgi:hypothetical protein
MVQLPDKYKLILLAAAFTGCTLTYFLPTASRNLVTIQTMAPPTDRYCHSIQQKYRNECKQKDETSSQCINLRADVQDCKDAIVSAYKRINIKCLGYSVQVQLCASDCVGESSEDSEENKGGDCGKICGEKADRLKECEREVVAKELRWYGIQDIVSLD